ncbi:MAG TPA: ABC transporter substrate-binding protein [Methanoregulaceae archaeon]|nr:ABC transporter substrate-binding protein [Methanoregulaceae archaeon]
MKPLICLLILIGIVLLAVGISGCTQPAQQTPGEVKIGVIVSMTGPSSNLGKSMWQSAVLAANEINANGGVLVNGKKLPVRVIQGDDASTQQGGQTAATKLITQDNVDILVGGYSSAVTSSYQQTVADNKIPFIVTGASSPIITHRTDIDTNYTFHYCPTTDTYGNFTTSFIYQVIRPEIYKKFNFTSDRPLRLAVIYQNSPYGKGVLSAVNQTINNNHLNVNLVSAQPYTANEGDFHTLLTAVKAAGPDVVYVAAFPNEQGVMIPQARRDVGLNTIFLAVENNDDPAYYTALGQYGEYSDIESRFSPYTSPKGPVANAAQAFKEKYNATWGTYPDMMGASTYEGTYIAAKAIENAGTLNKEQVKNALSQLSMPQMIEAMTGGNIIFSKDYREAPFELYMEQLYYVPALNECRPTVVWPDDLKAGNFTLPDWYQPGSP